MKTTFAASIVALGVLASTSAAFGQTPSALREKPPVGCILRPAPPVMCSEVKRPDGSSVRVTTKDRRVSSAKVVAFTEQLSGQLANPLGQYQFEEFSEIAARVASNQGVGTAGILIQLCWQGKRRQWCVGVEVEI
jgi:hypothetical protein